MTSKLNIFNSLPQHASDSEDETNSKNAKTRVRHENQNQRRNEHEKGTAHGHTAPKDPNQKEDVARQKNQHKTKGVTAEPHPNDRHSGTGSAAYGAKPKKSGTGKGNWGNFKEDRKAGEEGEDTETPEVQEEEKPEGITLSEYFANRNVATSQPQVNEAKSKITSEQLMKEVGKATVLKTRAQQEIDDKNVGKKKDKLNINHHAGINSEHANLLNFRTGFVEKEYRERVRGEEGNEPRRFGGPREHREKREKPEGQTETQGEEVQGEKPAVQAEGGEVAAPTEGKTQEQGQEGQKRREGGQQGGYTKGGNRGGYRGDRPQGDRPYGDRPQGERRPYNNNKQGGSTKVNVEDESAFPKLG